MSAGFDPFDLSDFTRTDTFDTFKLPNHWHWTEDDAQSQLDEFN